MTSKQPTMPGSIILSLDCEGLWGVQDNMGVHEGAVTRESMEWAYRTILRSLDRHGLRATFAFVGLFAMPPDEQLERLRVLRESPAHRVWTSAAYQDLSKGRSSGWEFTDALEWIRSSDEHEIASHSYSHLPLHEFPDSQALLELELDGVRSWAAEAGVDLRTYIFPRNQVSDLRTQPGTLLGFRDGPARGGPLAVKLHYLNPRGHAEGRPSAGSAPVAIPGGAMIQWRCGMKRWIPPRIAIQRWRSTLRDAARTGGCAHLWLHPHNLITGFRQAELLDVHLADAGKYVRSGRLITMTQEEYCRDVLSRSPNSSE